MSVTTSFTSYVRMQPSMCNYTVAQPVWTAACGIQASAISGCTLTYYGYQCGQQVVQSTTCGYELRYNYFNVVRACGFNPGYNYGYNGRF